MLDNVIKIVSEMTGASAEEDRRINAHHNFCELTPCRYRDPKTKEIIEKKLWVTRKGSKISMKNVCTAVYEIILLFFLLYDFVLGFLVHVSVNSM